MAFVGEAILSSFFDTLFDKLSSVLIDYTRQVQVHDELNKWEKTLKKINAVLEDAEEKQMEEKVVKIWLDDLSDLAYDVEDILDDLATQALGRQLMVETQPSTSKFRSLIPSCCTSFTPSAIKFNVEMRTKIENITARLENISSRKNNLLSTEKNSGKRSAKTREIPHTTSLVDEPIVYGRETEKAAIVDSLLHYHEPSDDAVRVIAIIGMAGVGKTTLAQFAYNHDGVKSHFDLRVWVCVSDEFDVVGVTRTILQSVASTSRKSDAKDLNQLQVQLNDELSGKKFLLVLDDVWSQDCNKWNLLYKPMRTGAQGSRVIVTTRDQRVVPAVRASSAYPLEVLSNDDCLSLFAQHAFIHTRNFDNHPHLRAVGERIVKKCRGLPLAAKALGGMLRTQLNRDAWEEILGSKIWELPKENNSILPALKLSYHHLPSHLKCCFAYCSIFPKDYEFNVDELVLLWMGEGFLHQVNRKKQMEEIGTAYFHELLARSFFQQSNHHSSQFVMHDLIHDLAQLVAGDVCFNLEDKLENDDQHAISARARHSCFTRQEFEVVGKFEAFDKAKNLRTLIAVPITMPQDSFTLSGKISNQVLHNLIMPMRYLRVLSLTDYIMGELPCLIGELIHLRYLNFSNSRIQSLPNSVGHLYNLQTLILRGCHELTELPIGIGKLKNLRHLDITRTSRLREMPFQFSNLTNLQVLTRFIVSKSRGVGIDELKNCSNLQGVLSISSLQEVVDVGEARAPNLKDKKKIEELTMQWSNDSWDVRNDICELHVLESLQPRENLKRLTIAFYGGSKFPSWLGDPSFSVMVELTLKNCQKCMLLPNLGGLSVLKVLCIEGMSQVKSIGAEFYGESMNPFASLKELRFKDMPEWENWSHSNFIKENVGTFPHLEKFFMRKCPKLIGELPKCLQSLVELEVLECPGLMCGLPKLASLRELTLKECDEAVLGGAQFDLPSLVTVNLIQISRLTCLRTGFTRSLVALQELRIYNCDGLTCLWEEQWLPCNLKKLEIRDCANLEKLSNGLQTLTRLEELEIWSCPKLESFPDSGFPPMLRRLELFYCEGLKSLPHNYSSCPLEVLTIECSPFLKCFPNGELPTTLKNLRIRNCLSLESLPEGLMHHNSTSSSNTCCLETLLIDNCSSLNSFPTGELPFTLKKLSITRCTNLESVSEKMSPNSTALEYLQLMEYPNLKSLQGCLDSLRKLVINDCGGLECFPERGLSIPNLEYLKIEGCENLKSLTHQMRNLKSLRSLTISECLGLESFPKEGLAPNLASLGINNCKNLKTPISEWGFDTLTTLSHLIIREMFPDMVSFPVKESRLLFSLTRLYIDGMESLASLALCNLISLRSLDISNCPNLWSLGPLPATLEELFISGCPTIEERYLKEGGEYWSNVAHIPCIYEGIQRYDIVDWMLDGIIDDLTFLDFNDSNFLI
ncbi:putative disease resistance RPP13-like protein 1 [Vitis vinifera]|uniref:Disease resistance RPP13-like protein 1 n=1 Tax=Vitis vinifera TaxID=29760 RepID=F6HVF4_VITVI|nr:putative disease resistance RPP13-like protein 1 [Vitis vinifera]XP_019080015.1 putative disease resistance RPP13-like protein 1 [Vitis vinifera]XP_019080018.1 putative disease resistance RPP13-like protein 1 [Vitis vinifera]XP_019080019.1 putative disease resistance RPP13-like protein 1 [Vitis vinifera]XP_059597620.1 putative disease resistance RPP13-like protein 1 [Vitis vinifera]XP_059597621.1 putative disease resistance RPP13-like protein 1 [Vitis vinifera]XP_059597622.1 putative disea|eukprot:XP_019080012.1 PREDICTED: putative disease resistance RPP13-like protein 1 isoform X1 [Vitis vinifera]